MKSSVPPPSSATYQNDISLAKIIPAKAMELERPSSPNRITITISVEPIPPGRKLATPSSIENETIPARSSGFDWIPIERKAK